MEKDKRARGAAAKTKASEAPSNLRPVLTLEMGLGLGLARLSKPGQKNTNQQILVKTSNPGRNPS